MDTTTAALTATALFLGALTIALAVLALIIL